jgi:hypothetical protein
VAVSSANSYAGAAAGNSTRGIFALGNRLTTRNKYTYACCTSTAAGVAVSSQCTQIGSAASNGTIGVNV